MTLAKDQPAISVVMVSYYTGPVLFEAIASVLAQTAPLELMLVDNGNPPHVAATLRAMAARDSRIRYLSGHGNAGFSKGCNIGARAARGTQLLFLNPDGVMPPGILACLADYAARLPSPFMLGARLIDEQGRDQRGCRRALLTPISAFIEAFHLGRLFPRLRLNRHEEAVPTALTPMPAISGAFMFLTQADFWRINGFDEDYFLHVDDLDFCLRFRRAGGEIYFAPDIIVMHVCSTSQASVALIERHKARGFSQYFHKNFATQYSPLFLWLLDLAIWLRQEWRIGLAAWRSAWN